MHNDANGYDNISEQQENNDLYIQTRLAQREGRNKEALDLYQELLKREPENGEAHYQFGLFLKKVNHPAVAVSHMQKAITLRIQRAEVFAELADTLLSLNHFQDAEAMAKAAITLAPDNLLALRSLVNTSFSLGRFEEARAHGELLISKSLDNAEDHILLAVINGDSSHYEESILHAEKAITLNPDAAMPYVIISNACIATGKWKEAKQNIEQALKREPVNPEYITIKANILEREGKRKQAFAMITPLLGREKKINTNTLQLYAKLSKHFGKQQQALEMLERVVSIKELPVRPRSSLLNTLGSLYDDVGQYDKAFSAFSESNRIRTHRYNAEATETNTQQCSEWFTPERLQNAPKSTHGSKRPIFIVGMPRSGTSLTERILARHPDVFGAGELNTLEHIALNELPKLLGTQTHYPEYLNTLTTTQANQAAQHYHDTISRLAPNDEPRVIDKMPMNFIYLGLIALLFPQSRIIHCTRTPLATGLSCYIQQFGSNSTLGFSQDLQDIAHYYKQYEYFMKHWHKVLPMPIYDLSYEALVNDQESETRKLLEFCELPWHQYCLEPHKAKENTATASYEQVRQPVHNKSVDHWKYYEKQLQPLRDALGLT